MNKRLTIVVILAMFVSAGCLSISDDTADAGSENALNGPDSSEIGAVISTANHVATLGSAFTNTVVQLGGGDKIVLMDTNSKPYAPANYSGKYVSTKSYADVAAELNALKDGWDKSTDIVITYGYTSEANLKILDEEGFSVIKFYPKTYIETTDYVTDMETILGTDHKTSTVMKENMNNITEKMSSYTGKKVSAAYVSYTSGNMKIGNTGIATSMMDICGAINAGADPDKKYAYEPSEGVGAFLTTKISEGTSVILLDGNYPGTASEFMSEVKITGVTVYKLDPLWNSYTPETGNGLVSISKYLYPEVFGSMDGGSDKGVLEDYLPYVLAIVVILIVAGAVYFLRRSKE